MPTKFHENFYTKFHEIKNCYIKFDEIINEIPNFMNSSTAIPNPMKNRQGLGTGTKPQAHKLIGKCSLHIRHSFYFAENA